MPHHCSCGCHGRCLAASQYACRSTRHTHTSIHTRSWAQRLGSGRRAGTSEEESEGLGGRGAGTEKGWGGRQHSPTAVKRETRRRREGPTTIERAEVKTTKRYALAKESRSVTNPRRAPRRKEGQPTASPFLVSCLLPLVLRCRRDRSATARVSAPSGPSPHSTTSLPPDTEDGAQGRERGRDEHKCNSGAARRRRRERRETREATQQKEQQQKTPTLCDTSSKTHAQTHTHTGSGGEGGMRHANTGGGEGRGGAEVFLVENTIKVVLRQRTRRKGWVGGRTASTSGHHRR